jgi:glycosyltransferase involved in cell wall biosynthesis
MGAHREAVFEHWKQVAPEGDRQSIVQLFDQADEKRAVAPPPINILICGFSLTTGGGEVFPIILANGLKSLGVNVTFCNFAYRATTPEVRRRLRADIPLLEIDEWAFLTAIIEDLKIDVVHSHHAWVDTTLAGLLRASQHCAFVVTTHGMYEILTPPEQRRIIELLKPRVDRFIYIAEKNLAPFDEEFVMDKQFVNIPNAIERKEPGLLTRSQMGIPEDAFVVCLVSRAIPEKGWQQAIMATRHARQASGADIHLLLVGDGPEFDRLKHDDSVAGVHLLGFRDDVQDLFSISDAGILPTYFSGESFPLVALECLAAGRPFVATEIGEIRRILSTPVGMAGFLIPLDDGAVSIQRWTKFLIACAEDRSRLTTLYPAVAQAHERYSSHAVSKVYLQCYRDTIQWKASDRQSHRS